MPSRLQTALNDLNLHLEGLGHQVVWAQPSKANPLLTLLVDLAGPDAGGPLFLELCFLEGLEEQLEKTDILQCFLPLITNIALSQQSPLCRIIARVNVKLPLVGFGYQTDTGLLFFKHDALLPRQDAARNDVVAEAVSLIGYQIALFAEPLISVATNRKTEAQALEGHPFSHLL